jgi:hypothetical protein
MITIDRSNVLFIVCPRVPDGKRVTDQDKAADAARRAFATEHGLDPATVEVVQVDRERIPNSPVPPGQMSIDPVRYRYFVELRSGDVSERLRVEAGHVYRA